MRPIASPALSLDALAAEPAQAEVLPLAIAAALLARCALAQGALVARLLVLEAERAQCEERDQGEDRLLTAREAGAILGVTPVWLFRHAKGLPFARRLSRKVLRFSEVGVRRYLKTRHG